MRASKLEKIEGRDLLITYFNFNEDDLDIFLGLINKYMEVFGENIVPDLHICHKECENPFRVNLTENLLFGLGTRIALQFYVKFFNNRRKPRGIA